MLAGAGQVSPRGLGQPLLVGTSWIQLEPVPPSRAHVAVAPTRWGQRQPLVSEGRGAQGLWGPQQELMGGGGREENMKTNPGGPKAHGRRNSCHEHHVPPTERLEVVVTLMQTPFCLGKVGAVARRARTSIGRVRLTPE